MTKDIITTPLEINVEAWQLNDSEYGLTGTIDGIHVGQFFFELEGLNEDGIPVFSFIKLTLPGGQLNSGGEHPAKLPSLNNILEFSSKKQHGHLLEINEVVLKTEIVNGDLIEIIKKSFTVIKHPPFVTIQGELTFTGDTAQRASLRDFNLVFSGSQGDIPVFNLVSSVEPNSQNMIILQAPNEGETSFDVRELSNFQTQSKGFGGTVLEETTTNSSGTTTKRGTVTILKDPGGNDNIFDFIRKLQSIHIAILFIHITFFTYKIFSSEDYGFQIPLLLMNLIALPFSLILGRKVLKNLKKARRK